MKGGFGLMNNFYKIFFLLFAMTTFADNEIYIDQSGATANLDIEQQGGSNIVGGTSAQAGSMTALDLDGSTMTLDINQIGSSNKFLGDIWADSYTGFFNFAGDSNVFNMQTDPSNTYGADNSNVNVQVTGNTNNLTLNQALAALASGLDLDWTVLGSGNNITAAIDIDGATNYMNIDGSDNTITYDGDGTNASSNGYFHLTHSGGNQRTFNITQQSTLNNDWLKITSAGSNGTFCVNQNDQGTATGCQ
tara:strand:- start:6262 stop:7005 length:744 start_codon:yes stop_codon:yes gene_type:complete